MNKRHIFLLFCVLFLAVLAFSTTAQESSCTIDFGPIQTALTNAQSAANQGNNGAALGYLTEIRLIVEGIEDACGGGLNWCYPGQPWGDGRCNGPDLTQEQIDWFWACGTYWAENEHGLLDVVPEWCGYVPDSDGDGYPDDVDQCPNQGGYVDGNGCPACDRNVDIDCDGTPDGQDQCPNDPGKAVPGICGCGVPDIDSDGDGLLDCNDACPLPGDDPYPFQPGDLCLTSDGFCWRFADVRDTDGDGCNDGIVISPSTSCNASTPACGW